VIKHFLSEITVGPLPAVSNNHELRIPIFYNIFNRLPVFLVLISVFLIKSLDNITIGEIITISAGLELPILVAAQLDLASGFIDIPLPVLIAQFTAMTGTT
jgi:hypothetical protein